MTDSQSAFEHHFTLAQANALLPWVSGIFGKVQELLSELEFQVPTAASAALPPAPSNGRANGHANGHANSHAAASQTLQSLSSAQKLELINALLAEVTRRGIVIQDPRRALIDFPGWRGEEEIFLCHERADGPAIRAWHGLHAGFAGRRPIAELEI